MKVLLDEAVPERLRLLLPGHEVFTVGYLGWKSLKNGTLLRTAESSGFIVFVTSDQGLSGQQNMQGRTLGIVVLSAQKIEELRPHLEKINEAVARTLPEMISFVNCS